MASTPPSMSDLLDGVSALLGRRDLLLQQEQDWAAGTPTGGPNGDGTYPIDDSTGFRRMIPSPAKLYSGVRTLPTFATIATQNLPPEATMVVTLGYYAIGDGGGATYAVAAAPTILYGASPAFYSATSADGRLWVLTEPVPFVEQFGMQGYPQTGSIPAAKFDNAPAFQAAIAWNEVRGGGSLQADGSKIYFNGTKITYDEVLTNIDWHGATIDWSLKSFSDFSTSPELCTNPSFDNAGTGWTVSANTTGAITYSPAGSVSMIQAASAAHAAFFEFGQQITAPAGSTVRITIEIGFIHTVQDTASNTPFNTLNYQLCRNNNAAGPVTLGNAPIINAPGGSIRNSASNYADGMTVTFDVVLSAANQANPYVRLQSNASIQINSVSCKIVPDNACLLMRSTSTQTGQQKRSWHNFKMNGRADQASLVDGVVLDSVSPLSSRAYFYNAEIATGMNRAIVFQNGAYLCSFHSCRFSGIAAGVDTLDGAGDAGENISFYGCILGSTSGSAINNRGMQFNLFGCSLDFPQYFYTGKGNIELHSCWLEGSAAADQSVPTIRVDAGSFRMFGGRIQLDGTVAVPVSNFATTPFYAGQNALVELNDVDCSNLISATDAFCSGPGFFQSTGMVGGANTPHIAKRDAQHNVIPDGSFEGSALAANMWIDSVGSGAATAQPDRTHVEWHTTTTYLADATIGSRFLQNTNTLPSTLIPGDILTGPGLPAAGVALVAINNSAAATTTTVDGATITLPPHSQFLSAAAIATPATQSTYRWTRQAPVATGSLVLVASGTASKVTGAPAISARTGAQALVLNKSAGIGNGNPLTTYLAYPVRRGCKTGFEFYYRVSPDASAPAASQTQFYLDAYWVSLQSPNGRDVPVITNKQYANFDATQTIDRQSGNKVVSGVIQTDTWNRVVYATQRQVIAGDPGNPPEWATHLVIIGNFVSVPANFEITFDDAIASNI